MQWVQDSHVHGYKIWVGDIPSTIQNYQVRDWALDICALDDVNCIRSKTHTQHWCCIMTIRAEQSAMAVFEKLKTIRVMHLSGHTGIWCATGMFPGGSLAG